jgi:hypothetical protein
MHVITQQGELLIFGVDFSSAPSVRKPITVAIATLSCSPTPILHLDRVDLVPDWPHFEAFLQTPGPWLGGFDLPFGQPRALIEHYGWPTDWAEFVDFFYEQSREDLRDAFKAWCDARPAGQKFAWRAADKPAGSSPAMRWTNPPVAWMMKEGAKRLKAAGVWLPAHQYPARLPASARPPESSGDRVALEAYPAFLVRQISRASYKSDTPSAQTIERRGVREQIVAALCRAGAPWPQLRLSARWRRRLVDEGSADQLDAVVCALQAAQAALVRDFGLSAQVDPLEGWIATVPSI